MVKPIRWNEIKNQLLLIQRKLSFEMVLEKIEAGGILARRKHPGKERYPHQYIFIVELRDYICFVPFVETEEEIFLKMIIPSRKLQKEFKGEENA